MFYQSRKSVIFVTVVVMLFYMLIGYGFNIDVLKIYFIDSDSFSLSLVGALFAMLTVLLVFWILSKYKKTRE